MLKLEKYLADYIEHEVTETDNRLIAWDNLDFEEIIKQGLHAFESTEDVTIKVDHEKIENINDINLTPLYVVMYRGEFEVAVRANSKEEAMKKAIDAKVGKWEQFGEIHPCFLEAFGEGEI